MDVKNLNIEKNKISTKSPMKLAKEKSRIFIFNTILWISSATLIGVSINNIDRYTKDTYNIYSGRKLTISKKDQENIIKNIEKKYNIKIKEKQKSSILFFDSIERNKKLTPDEKANFYGLADLIEDNPYIDKESAYTNLLNLDIKHKKNLKEKGLAGYWDGNDIYIEDTNPYWEQHVFFHEAIHAIHNNSAFGPKFIYEGMTELLASEYLNKPNMTYDEYINLVKMLCEIVGSDTVLKAYSTNDMTCIYNEMAKIGGKPTDAQELIYNIDYYLENITNEKLSNKQKEKLTGELYTLRKYYLKKNNEGYKEIDEANDLFDNYYMSLMRNIEGNYSYVYPRENKVYFNSEYKNRKSK